MWRIIATVRTSGQHRLDANPYYGNYVQQKCNHPDVRATPSERGPDMVLRKVRYGKQVAHLFVQKASACFWTPPREIKDRLDLDLLSL